MKKLAFLGIFAVVFAMFAALVSANPVWDSSFVSAKSVNEGSAMSITFNSTANDSIGGSTFTSTGLPTGASFAKVNDSSATLSWTPTFVQAGAYNIKLNVSDANSSDAKNITITVADTASTSSTDPLLSSISAQSVNEGKTLTFSITSTAPDFGSTTTFSKNVTFGTLTTVNSTLATFSWTPGFTEAGVYSVKFTATDGDGTASTQTTAITVVDVPAGISTSSELSLGSSTQRRSNPRAEDKADREVNVTGDVTITNTGSETLSNLSMSSSPKSGFTATDLLISVKFAQPSLAVGASTTASVTVRVPEKLDAVDSNLNAAAFEVSTLTFSANTQTGGILTSATALKMQAENQLKIRDLDVASGTKTEDVGDGDTVKDMKPGDNVKITIEAENKFTDNEDVEIDDIEFSVIADDLDVDEDQDVGSLSPKDKDTASIEFEIEKDADDDKHDAEIRLEGRDENGARHGEKWRIQLEVTRKSHEIAIEELRFSPSSVACEKEAELSLVLRNVGRNDEDDVTLSIESPDLKYGTVINKMEIDEDDETTQRFVVPLTNLTAGTYRLTASAYYEFDQFSNRDTVVLTAKGCGPEQPAAEKPAEKEAPESGVEVVPVQQPPVSAEPAKEEKGFFERPEYVALLVAANVVVLVGAIWLFAKLFAKP